MTQAKHTPGPWQVGVYKYGEHKEYRIIGSFDRCVATLPVTNHFDDYDACLIAAAPELLEALKYTQWHLERLGQTESDAYKRNALAFNKATGVTK